MAALRLGVVGGVGFGALAFGALGFLALGCDASSSDSMIVLPDPTATNVEPSSTGPGTHIDAPEPVEPDFSGLDCAAENPVPSQARLLTRLQYDNTVRDLFRGVVGERFAESFPPENEVLGFGTNAEFHRATPWLTEGHMAAAERIAALATESLPELSSCAAAADEACARSFIEEYGARAFRRPLTNDESEPLLALYRTGSAEQGFEHGVKLVVQALLQSPQFLYRLELDRSRPMSAQGGQTGYQIDSYEMASRLSYFLWGSMPDDELFAAAEADQLTTPEQIELHARRMLDSDKAATLVADFHEQWLDLDRFASVLRNDFASAEPDSATDGYSADWRASLDLFLHDAFWGQGGGKVDALLNSKTVFLNPNLAQLYGVELPAEAADNMFYPVEFEPEQRAGLLTQPALLALLSHSEQSAPIQRGVFIRSELLCQPAPPPPPTVDPTPPDPDPNATTRERFAQHTAAPECSGCHQLIDTLGLGLENFDQMGRFRSDEGGLPIDASGEVVGTREEAIRGVFDGGRELAERLAESEQVRDCMVTQWYRYSAGRVEQRVDLCSLASVRAAFTNADGDLREMLIAMAVSDAFMYRIEPELEAER